MNNALNVALMRIHTEIPEEILELMFTKREVWEKDYTVDQMLIEHVIRYRIRTNMNIFGGKIKEILLRPEYMEDMHFNKDDGIVLTGPFSIYRIPPEELEGQDLIDVVQVRYAAQYQSPHVFSQLHGYGNTLSGFGHSILESHTFTNSPPKPNVECLNGNLVRLIPSQRATLVWVLVCRITVDKDFTNLSTSQIDTFAKLAVATTKMIAYNKLIVSLDRAYVEAGQEISAIKMIVDPWSDMATRVQELEDELAGASLLDPKTFLEFAEYMV